MKNTIITKEIEWDMGHRVPEHKSKCKNLHGHRYKIKVYIRGDVVTEQHISNEGMVQDFGDIKTIIIENIHDMLDHGFMMYEKDKLKSEFNMMKQVHKQNIIFVPFIPTAENIAQWCFSQIESKINNSSRYLVGVKIHETPTCSAYYGR